ncbi:MAG: alpha-ketoacid dehydrogenase subunit beta [Terriglobales bacterium]|jgi:pyruvate/2-oxoglutarate/acetoin dehydrogenase E1 component
MRRISYVEALNEALKEEMRRDVLVFVMGEDVGKMGGLFKVTQGLLEEFGAQRVIDTPISEAAIAGAGVGSALVGARPVIEFQFLDFITIAMDQIVNHAAKSRYMTGGMVSLPLVVRAPVCGGIGLGAQHSQSLEAWFIHVPGIKVVMPSTPADAKGLLKSAIRDNNPILFLEHRLLYAQTGPVPEGTEYLVPLGVAEVKRSGTDVTVVATGRTVPLVLTAASSLSAEGIDVEVIDPRTLKPLDSATVVRSVRKTNRLVVVNDGWRTCGYAAELMAVIMEECFFDLDAPIQRVCVADVPMPAATALQKAVMVSEEDIATACRTAMVDKLGSPGNPSKPKESQA